MNMVRQSFQPLLAKADLPRIRFHDLRHSTATLLLTLGVHPKIVQELLGHSQIFMTLDIYSHILPTLQAKAYFHCGKRTQHFFQRITYI
jgi:integrase